MATIPTGRFVWFEYVSKDVKKAQAFFGEVFHWKTKDVPMPQGTYQMIMLGDKQIGGYLPTPQGAPEHAHWLSHLQVTNAQETANKVKQLGGRILKETMKMGDFGNMAVVADPMGAPLALWQPLKIEGEPSEYTGKDNDWIWNELYSDNPEKSIEFYKAIGGFEVKSMDMGPQGTYHVLESGGKGRAGIMKMQGVPPNWMPYVKVASCDATIAQAKRLGANIKMAGEDVPNVGRLGVFMDPLGAPLGVLQPAPGM
jgi:predicted enzyme related to lactoylglutathione lyase